MGADDGDYEDSMDVTVGKCPYCRESFEVCECGDGDTDEW